MTHVSSLIMLAINEVFPGKQTSSKFQNPCFPLKFNFQKIFPLSTRMRLKSREHFPLKFAEKFPLVSHRGLWGLKQPPLSPPLPGLEPTSSASFFCLKSGLKNPLSSQFLCNYFSFDVFTSIQATHDSHVTVFTSFKLYGVASIPLALLKEMRLIFV